ncbi:hypothetical protein BCR39DRAFT_517132 [Naematelia encephala]|uniref:Fork-head domain-containing protein n=1 Tax=Naematelia encephala TaxID=71784 RepID=A0A1Y2BHI5_9TREE|nr:hypothetical protein BCR39DRAFT_517132 [Naematelia encephala]
MARPGSAAVRNGQRPGSSMGAQTMNRIPTYSPTPSSQQSFYSQNYYPQHAIHHIDPQLNQFGESMAMIPAHQAPQGRMVVPMSAHPAGMFVNPVIRRNTPSPEMGQSPPAFLSGDGTSPFGHHLELPPASPSMHSSRFVSPSGHLDARHVDMGRKQSPALMGKQNSHFQPQPPQQFQSQQRPQMQHRHSVQAHQRTLLHRQSSLHGQQSSVSPHVVAGDVFDPTPNAEASASGPVSLGISANSWHGQTHDNFYLHPQTQGISPARALGPAPNQPQHFSPNQDNLLVTPLTKNGYPSTVHSSATSSTATTDSSLPASASSSADSAETVKRRDVTSSDDEHNSPTRGPSAARAMSKMQLSEKTGIKSATAAKPLPIMVRPVRPIGKPVISGGRTSAKFAKVAEDPGVEGIPAGPRPMDRPGPSFACIIGQAILSAKAGGLSLEHIYRYVETAYPYFKNGDGAWRNSVRHNLSIHKMFETIPRTEKFPPGKGGIWIIHEDEKVHWPEENKFIKNFPPTHAHHATCRQTLHERAKEKEAMMRAAREGRAYVPKKGKKGRKLLNRDEDEEDDMGPNFSSGLMPLSRGSSLLMMPPPGHPSLRGPPSIPVKVVHPPSNHVAQLQDAEEEQEQDQEQDEQDEDEQDDFLPMEAEPEAIEEESPSEPLSREDQLARAGIMVPPRFERERKRKVLGDEDDGVFSVTTKRVRVAEPLAPIIPPPQESVFDDSFITPERPERPVIHSSKATGSAFKTPALINTSSSPGSSPMPPTVTRSAHLPSALQQAWTHDDMTSPTSPPRPMLDAAFDLKPKQRMLPIGNDEVDFIPSLVSSGGMLPKTPLSRSSAATERTPRAQMHKAQAHKTPIGFRASPPQPPASASMQLSTPQWEAESALDRLRDCGGSPTRMAMFSPLQSTDPTRYAYLMESGSPKKARDFAP